MSAIGEGECAEFNIASFVCPPGAAHGTPGTRIKISIMITCKTDSDLDFSVILYEQPPLPTSSNETCSKNIDSISKTCTECRNYVRAIYKGLDKITMAEADYDFDLFQGAFKTYTPYIARVVDSWFRDTFFVVPSNPDEAINDVYADAGKRNNYGSSGGQVKLTKGNIEYVKVDEEYLKETDEYWSKYETYYDNTTGEIYYKLYQLNNNGTLNLTGHKYIRCKDDDGKEVYKNLSTGATEPVEGSNLKLVKKAETGADITSGWSNSASGVWSVYDNTAQDASGVKNPLVVGANSDTKIQEVAEYLNGTDGPTYRNCFYYEMAESAAIKQKEDARRGITNPTIKQMFKIRKYYIYDGSEEKAIQIYENWKKVKADHQEDCYTHYSSKPYFQAKYSDCPEDAKKERAVEMALDDLYYNNSGPFAQAGKKPEECDPRDKALIGNITINKDTLNAFSILENTKTLDADYQYRDFKELIVELDYFDKEDLSDKTDRVLEWIIPSCTDKWPFDVIDKSKDYYGTLIHSKDAITQLKTDLVTRGVFEHADAIAETELGDATGYEFGQDVISPVTGEIINCGKYYRVNTDYLAANYPGETADSLKAQGKWGEITEEVGFVQIKVLDEADINLIKNDPSVSGSVTVDGQSLYYDDIWYSYYNEYTGVCAGHIITIEGIDPLAIDVEGLKTAIANRATLQPNETPKLVDKNEEKKNQALEKAKVEKLPAKLDVNGRLFVTEGAIIGKTVASTEFPEYSYTRLILRDQKLGIVENLEDYFDFNDN